jgi:surface antigen
MSQGMHLQKKGGGEKRNLTRLKNSSHSNSLTQGSLQHGIHQDNLRIRQGTWKVLKSRAQSTDKGVTIID